MQNELEPWLTGTHTDVHAVQRAVVHALELAERDLKKWVFALGAEQLDIRPFQLPSVAFQVRHISRSMDRLLTYAEGRQLSEAQLAALASEADQSACARELVDEFTHALQQAIGRVLNFRPEHFEEPRGVGRAGLPGTVAGLLIHVAEHTQRHVGQAITTAKVVAALRDTEQS